MKIDEIINVCRLLKNEGMNNSDIVIEIEKQGFTITESIKIVHKVCGGTFGQAKSIVEHHSIWKEVVENSESVQNDFWNAIQSNHD